MSEPAPSKNDSVRPQPTAATPERLRILLAEDDREMRRIVGDALRKAGHDILEVSSGYDCESVINQATAGPALFHVLVADIRMPGPTGLELATAARKKNLPLAIVLMTAFGDERTRAEAVALHAVLLDKPFRIDALHVAVVASMRLPL